LGHLCALEQCHLVFPEPGILHKLWGSQSWLPPAFSRRAVNRHCRGWGSCLARKSRLERRLQGKIACPTTNAEMLHRAKLSDMG
jgi:hypothetical protein